MSRLIEFSTLGRSIGQVVTSTMLSKGSTVSNDDIYSSYSSMPWLGRQDVHGRGLCPASGIESMVIFNVSEVVAFFCSVHFAFYLKIKIKWYNDYLDI